MARPDQAVLRVRDVQGSRDPEATSTVAPPASRTCGVGGSRGEHRCPRSRSSHVGRARPRRGGGRLVWGGCRGSSTRRGSIRRHHPGGHGGIRLRARRIRNRDVGREPSLRPSLGDRAKRVRANTPASAPCRGSSVDARRTTDHVVGARASRGSPERRTSTGSPDYPTVGHHTNVLECAGPPGVATWPPVAWRRLRSS